MTGNHIHAVLLAGGKGTRFWPLSREDHPKQMLQLFSDRMLIEETCDRIQPLIPGERILVATSLGLSTRLNALFADIPDRNFIVEPVPRNTLPCIAVAARKVLDADPDGIVVVLPSDHFVADRKAFLDVIESAVYHANRGRIVTLGVTPTHPETGYGYIRFGEFEAEQEGPDARHRARHIQAFVEKPDHATALSYLKAGRYLWNSGIFVFRADVILDKVREHQPTVATNAEAIARLGNGAASMDQAERLWTEMPDLSIDYGIMEKAEGLVVIPASFGWSDVGSWRALTAFPTDPVNQNFTCGRVLPVESTGNVLYTSHGLLATVGLSNMVVVVTRGAVLVCPVDRTQDVKMLVEELKKQDLTEYL